MSKKVSLVLSSGGARGMAHVGAIEALLTDGYEIGSVAGSSMGAVVGGVYAAGKLNEFKEWMCSLDKVDVFNLVDFTLTGNGLIRGEKVFNEIKKLIGDPNIEELSIPYAAVATDILEKKEVVFREGKLFDAMRASIAIPTVMTPFYVEKKPMIDGGVLNPLPIDAVSRSENDLLVVVNVNANIPYERPFAKPKVQEEEDRKYNMAMKLFKEKWKSLVPKNTTSVKKMGFFELLSKSYDLTQDSLTYMLIKAHQPDLLIDISREACGTFEFYRSAELIEAGSNAYENTQSVSENRRIFAKGLS
ncbi:patatin-like phospholipase family protein [Flammeovirgaceae bacterium SG7u.111]|nr:patatin-like phospholipase family protein [Flammeovirgaceae bacterium SG7u.132]WPO37413.1 patatin-like phospholipase family protein [Flammeovirgaceae bacterium SG7u.111]